MRSLPDPRLLLAAPHVCAYTHGCLGSSFETLLTFFSVVFFRRLLLSGHLPQDVVQSRNGKVVAGDATNVIVGYSSIFEDIRRRTPTAICRHELPDDTRGVLTYNVASDVPSPGLLPPAPDSKLRFGKFAPHSFQRSVSNTVQVSQVWNVLVLEVSQ